MTTPTVSMLKVEWWPTEKPIAYARNARVCPESAISKVAASIHEFGFKNPILVDGEGVIIAGHTRLLAAQRLELAKVPVIVCADLSPAKVKALRLADNRTAQETSWDADLLPLELADLAEFEYDLALTGFEPDELAAFLAEETEGLTDPDDVPDVPEEPVSQPGDLYLLGEHRLLCGDATSAEDVTRLMAGKRATLMPTDPPYLVNYEGGSHPSSEANGGIVNGKRVGHDERRWDEYVDHAHSVDFYVDFLRCALDDALTDDAAVYEFYAVMRSEVIWQAWREVGLLAHQVVVWKKTRSVLTYSWYLWNYEPILVGWPQGHQPKMHPPADTKAVWEVESKIEDGASGIHPTQKPIELIRRPISFHTRPGGLIYEPFSGSGTALIAAEEMGRTCYAMEQAPQFVDVAVVRWEAFTGRKAERE